VHTWSLALESQREIMYPLLPVPFPARKDQERVGPAKTRRSHGPRRPSARSWSSERAVYSNGTRRGRGSTRILSARRDTDAIRICLRRGEAPAARIGKSNSFGGFRRSDALLLEQDGYSTRILSCKSMGRAAFSVTSPVEVTDRGLSAIPPSSASWTNIGSDSIAPATGNASGREGRK